MLTVNSQNKIRASLISIFQILSLLSLTNLTLCYDNTNALLRSQMKDLVSDPPEGSANSFENFTEAIVSIHTSVLVNETNPQELNSDYDLEADTNKTKRSKAAVRWLKSTLGFGRSGTVEAVTSDSETESPGDEESTTNPGSTMLSFDPFHVKRKVSSKVSGVANAANKVYETIAGAVGLGRGKSVTDGPNDDDMDGRVSDNSDASDFSTDDQSGAGKHSPVYNCCIVLVFARLYLLI